MAEDALLVRAYEMAMDEAVFGSGFLLTGEDVGMDEALFLNEEKEGIAIWARETRFGLPEDCESNGAVGASWMPWRDSGDIKFRADIVGIVLRYSNSMHIPSSQPCSL